RSERRGDLSCRIRTLALAFTVEACRDRLPRVCIASLEVRRHDVCALGKLVPEPISLEDALIELEQLVDGWHSAAARQDAIQKALGIHGETIGDIALKPIDE